MQRMFTVDEVAGVLRQSKYTIRSWIKRGVLPASKVGQKWLVAEPTIQAMIGLPATRQKLTREESHQLMLRLQEESRRAGVTKDTYAQVIAKMDEIEAASMSDVRGNSNGPGS